MTSARPFSRRQDQVRFAKMPKDLCCKDSRKNIIKRFLIRVESSYIIFIVKLSSEMMHSPKLFLN